MSDVSNNEGVMCDTEKFDAEFMTMDMLRIVRPDKFEDTGLDVDLARFPTLTYKAPEQERPMTKKEMKQKLKKEIKLKAHK
jgi:hypothetical protein